jgi:hypothetical protein
VDDILIMAESLELCIKHTQLMVDTLHSLGWHISWDKSVHEPSRVVEFLGFLVDSTGPIPCLRVPYDKKRNIRNQVRRLIQAGKAGPVAKRRVSQVAGLCNSVMKAISPTRMLTRSLHNCLNQTPDWEASISLTKPALEDLDWFLTALTDWDGRALLPKPHSIIVETDASNFGFGAQILNTEHSLAGHWTQAEKNHHINWKELVAVERALLAFLPQLKGKSVLIRSDNMTTVAFLRRMTGRSEPLAVVARRIFLLVEENEMTISAIHLPGTMNTIADKLSRMNQLHDWRLNQQSFQLLENKWGPHTVDRFADSHNHLLPRYNSWFNDPEAEARDALSQDWSKDNNLVVPPTPLLPRVVTKLRGTLCPTTIVVPSWPRQPWYQELCRLAEAKLTLGPAHQVSLPNAAGENYLSRNKAWRLIAFRISPPSEPRL